MRKEISKTGKSDKKNILKEKIQIYAASGIYKGEVNIQWDAVCKAKQYVIQVSAANTDKWIQVDIISEPYYKFSRLKTGRTYLFRIAAVFSNGQGVWSRHVSKKI